MLVNNLLLELKKGNTRAFSQIYDLYVNILFNFGCRLTTDRELLKDCIHDVFLKFYSKREELSDIEHFKSYLFISLKNKLCDEHRKQANMTGVNIDEIDVAAKETVEGDYLDREKSKLQILKVKRLLGELSPRQKKAITLYYIEEKKYQDICTIMDMNYQSVRNLIHRGMQ
ncbi:MAG: RNA polymerase sigma factor, partial [Bacteroidales bacterium]